MNGRSVVCKACNRQLIWTRDGYVTCPAGHMDRHYVQSPMRGEMGQTYDGPIGWLAGTFPISVPASEVCRAGEQAVVR